MSYDLELVIEENIDSLYEALQLEKIKRDRSTIDIKKQKCLKIRIKAQDPVALRATFDGILKLIIVHDKMVKNVTG